jgi:hypothetical protein
VVLDEVCNRAELVAADHRYAERVAHDLGCFDGVALQQSQRADLVACQLDCQWSAECAEAHLCDRGFAKRRELGDTRAEILLGQTLAPQQVGALAREPAGGLTEADREDPRVLVFALAYLL